MLTPHIAGVTYESLERIGEVTVEQTLALLRGEVPRHLVNEEAIEAIQERLGRLVGKPRA